MTSLVPLHEMFDISSFETVAESPVSYITTACLLTDRPSSLLAIKTASTLREYSRQPHDIRKELRILSSLSHPNIISAIGSTYEAQTASIHFWMPFVPYSLSRLLATRLFSPYAHVLSAMVALVPEYFETLARSIGYQLLSALEHLQTHDPPIAHRDIKPDNILITPNGCLKLVDFGVAWMEGGDAEDLWPEDENHMCPNVCTGPYRAPETLFSPHIYDPLAVDMWCAGATFAELFTALRHRRSSEDVDDTEEADQSNVPQAYVIPSGIDSAAAGGPWLRDTLFDDRNGTLGLAWSIFQTMGSPTEQNWPSFSTLPDASKLAFADASPVDLRTRLPNLPPSRRFSTTSPPSTTSIETSSHPDDVLTSFAVPGDVEVDTVPLDFLTHLLVLEPTRRLRATEALRHPWFSSSEVLLPLELSGSRRLGDILDSFIPKTFSG